METELPGRGGRGEISGGRRGGTDERDVQGAGVAGSSSTDARLHTSALTNSQHSQVKNDGDESEQGRFADNLLISEDGSSAPASLPVPQAVILSSVGKKEVNGFIWPVVDGTLFYLAGFDGASVNCADTSAAQSDVFGVF